VHKLNVPREFCTKNALYLKSGNFVLIHRLLKQYSKRSQSLAFVDLICPLRQQKIEKLPKTFL